MPTIMIGDENRSRYLIWIIRKLNTSMQIMLPPPR